jgi:signal transduction histidine kinase
MALTNAQVGLVLVFFIYGLAFFTMGIALTLEAWRSSSLNERRLLRPLAIFGLMHGIHEWLEIIMLQGIWLKSPFPDQLSWIRVAWLAASFLPLILFGVMSLNGVHPKLNMLAGFAFLGVFLILAALQVRTAPVDLVQRVDVLSRYVLAIPGGLIAGLALYKNAARTKSANRRFLSNALFWSAVGFTVYGFTQVFVSPVSMYPASVINSSVFSQVFGFPIQVIRAGMALLVTVSLLFAIKIISDERQAQLVSAKQARLDALERVQQELEAREVLRRELLRHTVLAQEEERSRIARELHDETAQLLTAFSLNLATLQMSLPKKSDIDVLAERLQDQSKQLSQGVYRLVRDLRPAQLDDLGLIPALKYLVDQEKERNNLKVTLQVDGARRRLDSIVETVIFRVVQESLTNVARHAQVCQAAVHLVYSPHEIVLSIKDEGVGFDPHAQLVPPHGWGLAGMRERVESVRGKFTVVSAPAQGTSVEVVLPLESSPG